MIEDFSDFQNRFFNGITASNATGVAVEVFDHAGWDQPSIIVSIPGMSTKTIVVGAHQDSIIRPCYQVPRDYAPGADDNASGVATLIEALRAILRDPDFAQGHVPNTLEFHFYAAEEGGGKGKLTSHVQEGTIAAVLDIAEAPENTSEPRAPRTAEHKYWELGQHKPQRGFKFVRM
ncbi:peptidase M28 [Aspergillus oryzae]|uniref:Peptide hydrolase n=1 Tax=Aspergillus oryzae TaxID=5062 RepID=A0A1S9DBL3_ASPOZ|nr:peptidase M28 [Aspergillus oryzae]